MTSVAGTTTGSGTGSIQKLKRLLKAYAKEFKIPVECWWQSDIDAEVDAAPDSLKWSYQEMLAGSDAMRYLIHGSQIEGQAARMRDTVLQVMASQWREDAKVKFRQVDMDRVNVAEVFIDVNASVEPRPQQTPTDRLVQRYGRAGRAPVGALAFMLRPDSHQEPRHPLVFLLGVPGQGKSTLSQYLSQVHRAAILPGDMLAGPRPAAGEVADPKLPLRVDLEDYASWLSGQDPFGDEETRQPPRRRKRGQRSLELFLADFCSARSGGRRVSVEDVQSLLARYPVLLVLDGLDEVPGPDLRAVVVEEINAAAARMGATSRIRRFQVLVTARPNASGLAEPDHDLFQTLRLEPLTAELQGDFISKWCNVNDIHGRARRDIRRTFLSRTAIEQLAQLADNPMHLTILLFLINRKGEAVPTSLTPLYSDYMATLLDREVSRKQIDREQVPLIQEITAFLGWHMHAGVEADPGAGRMTRRDIETTLLLYFRETGGPEHLAGELLKAATDRFWALTSKVDGTFEFAVQPVREYFAARFLAEWAGRDRRDPLPKQEVLRRLIGRTYWLNVARFYAGFASPNELAGLRYGLEDAIEGNRHPLQERAAAWGLLNDGIFANTPRVQRDVARLLTDDLSVHLMASQPGTSASFPPLPRTSGGSEIASALMDDLQADPGGPLAPARAAILRDRTGLDRPAVRDWWTERLTESAGRPDEAAWLNVGGAIGFTYPHQDASRVALGSAGQCQAALCAGVSPGGETDAGRQLLRAVLDGWCSDVTTPSNCEAGALLRAMRPQWFHQIPEDQQNGPKIATGHLWVAPSDRSARSAAWSRLTHLSPKYEALRRAANPRGRGQKGTTEPWQSPARELARLHGPCWLAAEIAIAGAVSRRTIGSGSIDREGEPFGESADYGTFVVNVHQHQPADWWEAMHGKYADPLSRRTWSIALLATADADTVISNLGRVDACLTRLADDEYLATAASSSRLGVMPGRRTLPARIWSSSAGLSPRTRLLIAHFTARLTLHDPLRPLRDPNWKHWPPRTPQPGPSPGRSPCDCSPRPARSCSGPSKPSARQRRSTCPGARARPAPRQPRPYPTRPHRPRSSAS